MTTTDQPDAAPPADTDDTLVHTQAVNVLADLTRRLGAHHPVTEHVRRFTDRPQTTEPSPINFDALPDTVRLAYNQAVEQGWNYQLRLEPTDTTKPVLAIAVIQPDSLEDWVGLLDEGQLIVSGDGTPV